MCNPSPDSGNIRQPHPLAAALIERVRELEAHVLEVGAGSGRNTAALRNGGLRVHSIDDADAPDLRFAAQTFDAALSTHAFLHGTPAIVTGMLSAVAQALRPDAPFYCTFTSKRDARYGSGTQIEEDTYAPDAGDEAGVAHAYFDENGLRTMLESAFIIESLTEENVDSVVGTWAHARRPTGSVHWFLRARKRG